MSTPPPDRGVFVRLDKRWRLVLSLAPGDPDPAAEVLDDIAAAHTGKNGGFPPTVRILTTPQTHRSVVAQLWDGPVVLRSLAPGDPDLAPEELDHLAGTASGWAEGVKPSVRVLEVSTLPGSRSVPGTVPPRRNYR